MQECTLNLYLIILKTRKILMGPLNITLCSAEFSLCNSISVFKKVEAQLRLTDKIS